MPYDFTFRQFFLKQLQKTLKEFLEIIIAEFYPGLLTCAYLFPFRHDFYHPFSCLFYTSRNNNRIEANAGTNSNSNISFKRHFLRLKTITRHCCITILSELSCLERDHSFIRIKFYKLLSMYLQFFNFGRTTIYGIFHNF